MCIYARENLHMQIAIVRKCNSPSSSNYAYEVCYHSDDTNNRRENKKKVDKPVQFSYRSLFVSVGR